MTGSLFLLHNSYLLPLCVFSSLMFTIPDCSIVLFILHPLPKGLSSSSSTNIQHYLQNLSSFVSSRSYTTLHYLLRFSFFLLFFCSSTWFTLWGLAYITRVFNEYINPTLFPPFPSSPFFFPTGIIIHTIYTDACIAQCLTFQMAFFIPL